MAKKTAVSRGRKLTADEYRKVRQQIKQAVAKRSKAEKAVMQQANDDLDWVAQHEGELLRQYEGELIVVHQRQVIAHGHDEAALMHSAASAEHPRDELVVVEMLSSNYEVSTDALT